MSDAVISVPTFVHHDTGPILSIDCHPSGTKFITCGQKSTTSKGLVVVWNMDTVLDKNTATNENVPKTLFQLDPQSQSNTCRWSPDGKRFAFGSDDSSVSVFEYAGRVNSQGSIGSGAKNVERYKECCILRGHRMEVLSVEWSPNGRFLASGSLDYRIIIYNARKLPQQIAMLTDCDMPVKGLSWDPIGKYLASLEGDKKLKFWSTDTWQCLTTVTEPFATSIEETVLSRLDWSPDGKYLITPAAVQKGESLVKLIHRKSWKSDTFLAGHRKGTTCVRVAPRLVDVTMKNGKKMQMTWCAVGSRDKSISLWVFPGSLRPVLVLDNLFHHTVMDFAWCGRNLLACSADGTIKVLTLSESLFGEMLSKEAMSDMCHSIYSIRPPQYESAAQEEENSQDSFSIPFVDQASSAANASFITCPEEVLARRKQQEHAPNPLTTTSTAASSITTTKALQETNNPKEKNDAKAKEQKMLEERKEQTQTIQNGKRRIQPMFCGTLVADDPSVPVASSEPTRKVMAPPPPKKRPLPVAAAPVAAGDVDLEDSSDDSDEEEEEEDESDVESVVIKKKKEKTTENPMLAMDLKKPVLRPMEPKSLQTKEGTVLMEAPEQQPRISQHVMERKGMFVEVDNRWKHAGVETTQVKLVKKKQEATSQNGDKELMDGEERRMVLECVWMTIVGAPVVIVAANKHHVMLGCGDKCIRVYRTLCGSLLESLRIDSLPVLIGVKDNSGYALTENGRLSTWNLKLRKAVVIRQALFDCVEATTDNSLISVDVSDSGVPLIVFSNGSIFTFNVAMASWIQVSTTNALGRLTAAISDGQLEVSSNSGPLVRLLKRMRKQTTAPGVAPLVVKAIKEAQLEQLFVCAEQLGNPHDYQTILMLYVETLCEGGSEKKLKNILNELSRSGAPMQVCGVRRAALCDDVTRLIKQRQPAIAEKIVAGAASTVPAKTRSLF